MDIINGAVMSYGGARDVTAAQNIQKSLDYKINGDYISDFKDSFTNAADKAALPSGAAANSASASSPQKKIDKNHAFFNARNLNRCFFFGRKGKLCPKNV